MRLKILERHRNNSNICNSLLSKEISIYVDRKAFSYHGAKLWNHSGISLNILS